MAFVTLSSLEMLLVVGLIFLGCMKDTSAQTQNPVMGLIGSAVELTIVIPNNEIANSASIITIKHDNGNSNNLTEVLFSVNGVPKLKVAYEGKITVTQTGKRLSITFRNVVAADAGNYKCYPAASTMMIADCGQLLVVIRKPQPPTVTMLSSSSALVGSRLELLCETHSISLPVNHGLASEVWWYNQNDQPVSSQSSGQRIYVGVQRQLVIGPLQTSDKGLKFYCTSSDDAGDVTKRILSDKSALFEVNPEYKPSPQDFMLTPAFQSEDVVAKRIGQVINYKCEVDCWPRCSITWTHRPNNGSTQFVELVTLVDKTVLVLVISRINEGAYQCRAENKHGTAVLGFLLEALYLDAPTISINKEEKNSATILEDSSANLQCVFDSNPMPMVNWISPSQVTLLTQRPLEPEVVVDGEVIHRRYLSGFTPARLKCEDAGTYKCHGKSDFGSAEGLIELVVTCPPSSADVPGLGLMDNYVWEISKTLSLQFVIRAFPEPNISQIVSSLNGISRLEEIPKDMDISKTPQYDGKAHLTKFMLTSRRVLDENDADRVYTMTFVSSEFKKDFVFHIHPRGPPHEVLNLTAIDVGHESLKLFWRPGFNGGEVQTFVVEHRIRSPSELDPNQNHTWTLALENVKEETSGNWVEVSVGSLRSSTDYVVRVKAINALGSSVAEIKLRTAEAPASLGAGAICGIVFAVIIVLVIVAVILYFFVYKKRFRSGRGHGGTRKPIIPERITALFVKNKSNTSHRTSKARSNGPAQKEGPWGRVRKLFLRDGSRNSMDYLNVPPKDYIEDNHESAAVNNNAVDSNTSDSSTKMDDPGLIYIEVDFPNDDKKKSKKVKDKKKKKKNNDFSKSNTSVNYSDIDFAQTALKRIEIEEADRIQQGEDEEHQQTDENRPNKYADAGYGIGTTV